MQFYLDGYRPGDPRFRPAAPQAQERREQQQDGRLPEAVDVLVAGTGPAGTVLSAQLAEFPQFHTLVVEKRGGPLELGQADGVACRTVETFEAFGLAQKLMREAHWINETVFWRPKADAPEEIERSGRVQDVADGLSEYPHVIVNQARMQEFLLENMRESPSRLEPAYGWELVRVENTQQGEHPVVATLRRADDQPDAGREATVRARYAVGCEGARSKVRESLGIQLEGDSRNHAWGVIDALAVTDFPDSRFKAAIQSDSGSILLIPREGGYLVRYYVDMGELDPADRGARHRITREDVIAAAQKALRPYTLDVQDTAWWSVYEVGQRVAPRFDDVPEEERGQRTPRIFITGDACHTHSAKAGQGMNVSMQDGFNLGWKLAAVLTGRSPESLLETYSTERQTIAQELIDFDTEWSAVMGAKPKSEANPDGVDAATVQEMFTQSGVFTAGFGTVYPPNMITGQDQHQSLATGFPIGERFHSAPVVRIADAKRVGLGHQAQADGRWRLYAFADAQGTELNGLLDFLQDDPESPLRRCTPQGADPDAVLDLRAVLQTSHTETDESDLHPLLLPRKGPFGLIDHEKAFTPDRKSGPDIFTERGVDTQRGALVVVRPDQYIAHVLPLSAHHELAEFFRGVLLDAR